MPRNSVYNTKQRDALLVFFKEHPNECFSAKEIVALTNHDLGETTVYRTLSMLTKQGFIKKFARNDKEAATYQLNSNGTCHEHFHLKCKGCGKLIHMDCHMLAQMNEHIKNDHDFHVDSGLTVFYGECSECFSKGSA